MTGETNLEKLIQGMEPVLNPGEYVFCTLQQTDDLEMENLAPIGMFRKPEGSTLILDRIKADEQGLSYHYIASWITLNIHSALEAVGLTAAFSAALAQHNISCNVVAGYYHDHLFVDKKDAQKALEALTALSNKPQ